MQRGLGQEEAVALIVNGFAKEVLQQLPMEFAVEAQKLLGISSRGAWGDETSIRPRARTTEALRAAQREGPSGIGGLRLEHAARDRARDAAQADRGARRSARRCRRPSSASFSSAARW